MSYQPRPDSDRTSADIDSIYALAAEALQLAPTASARRKAFHAALLQAYEAGVDAQREIFQTPLNGPLQPLSDIPDDTGIADNLEPDDEPTNPCIPPLDPPPGPAPRTPKPPGGVFKPTRKR